MDYYRLNGYLSENRNLYRINETNKRQKLLKQGRLPVVSFISEMPQTRHYLNTFTMDISLITVNSYLSVNNTCNQLYTYALYNYVTILL